MEIEIDGYHMSSIRNRILVFPLSVLGREAIRTLSRPVHAEGWRAAGAADATIPAVS